MAKWKKNFHNSIRNRTLFGDAILWLLTKRRIIRKYTADLAVIDRAYHRLEKKYKKTALALRNELLQHPQEHQANRTVWLFWWQGMDTAPTLVKACNQTVRKHFADWNIVVIDKNNFEQYVHLPDYILEKHQRGIITHTHFSDILRLALLIEHGGLWLDATVFCTGGIEPFMEQCNLFLYRNGWMNQETLNTANWLIYATAHQPLLEMTQRLLYCYYQKHKHISHYFIFHMFFRLAAELMPEEWNQIPYFHHVDCHILNSELANPYDAQRFRSICLLTHFHKLSSKGKDLSGINGSFYYQLIEKNADINAM